MEKPGGRLGLFPTTARGVGQRVSTTSGSSHSQSQLQGFAVKRCSREWRLIGDVMYVHLHGAHSSMQRNWQLGGGQANCPAVVPKSKARAFRGVNLDVTTPPLSRIDVVDVGQRIHTAHCRSGPRIDDSLPPEANPSPGWQTLQKLLMCLMVV